MTNETLEEIFWKDGKFVNSKNEEVNPKPLGNPIVIGIGQTELKQLNERISADYSLREASIYSQPNAFLRGKFPDGFEEGEKFLCTWQSAAVQFYKI